MFGVNPVINRDEITLIGRVDQNREPVDEKTTWVAKDKFKMLASLLFASSAILFFGAIAILPAMCGLTVFFGLMTLRTASYMSERKKVELIIEGCKENISAITQIEQDFPQLHADLPKFETRKDCLKYFEFLPALSDRIQTLKSLLGENNQLYSGGILNSLMMLKNVFKFLEKPETNDKSVPHCRESLTNRLRHLAQKLTSMKEQTQVLQRRVEEA